MIDFKATRKCLDFFLFWFGLNEAGFISGPSSWILYGLASLATGLFLLIALHSLSTNTLHVRGTGTSSTIAVKQCLAFSFAIFEVFLSAPEPSKQM